MRNSIGHIILIAYLPLIVLFQFGQLNFVHYHVNENGQVISHSHPYQIPNSDEDPINPGHNHSSSELIMLGAIDGAMSSSPSCLVLSEIHLNVIEKDYQITEVVCNSSKLFASNQFRGPPCV